MEVFRLSVLEYSKKLAASGRAGRWNKDNEHVIYTASSRSLATLELVVNRSYIKRKAAYKIMVISIRDEKELYTPVKGLPSDWRTSSKARMQLQSIGSRWYSSQKSLVLEVPSAIITNEYNYIINTTHPDFSKNINLIRQEDYFWDDRLFSGGT